MRQVIRWMLLRKVASSHETAVLREVFDGMPYADFRELDAAEITRQLHAVRLYPTVDRAELALKILRAVVGKTITSLVEAGALTGQGIHALERHVKGMDARTVLALPTAPDLSATGKLQRALEEGVLVEAFFKGTSDTATPRAVTTGDDTN